METSILLSQAKEFIKLDIEDLNIQYDKEGRELHKSIIAGAIRARKEWIREYNMLEGIGCINCGDENVDEGRDICRECDEKSKESAYN